MWMVAGRHGLDVVQARTACFTPSTSCGLRNAGQECKALLPHVDASPQQPHFFFLVLDKCELRMLTN